MKAERGSTIPLILGFFLVAAFVVAGAVALGDAFVQQRNLQDICDGLAAAVAASAADLDRGTGVGGGSSLQFSDVRRAALGYLARDPERRSVRVRATLSRDRQRVTLSCEQTTPLAFGALFGRPRLRHVAFSTARAAVLG
jgi:hypothetical protein